jgi:hypothetical protein
VTTSLALLLLDGAARKKLIEEDSCSMIQQIRKLGLFRQKAEALTAGSKNSHVMSLTSSLSFPGKKREAHGAWLVLDGASSASPSASLLLPL